MMRLMHKVLFLGLVSEILLLIYWAIQSGALTNPSRLIFIVLAILPLALFLRGAALGRIKACSALAFVLMLYFAHGVSELFAVPQNRVFAALEIGITLAVFVAIVFYVRGAKNAS